MTERYVLSNLFSILRQYLINDTFFVSDVRILRFFHAMISIVYETFSGVTLKLVTASTIGNVVMRVILTNN